MKNVTRSNIYLPMAAIILTAVLAVPAAAQTQVPFKVTMQGPDTDTCFSPCPPPIVRHYKRQGNWHPCRSIHIHPGKYRKHRERH